ncbi:MAG TPA: DNA internalization-related competence protein ComEC/Rec2, partial [Clostridia bacterium]
MSFGIIAAYCFNNPFLLSIPLAVVLLLCLLAWFCKPTMRFVTLGIFTFFLIGAIEFTVTINSASEFSTFYNKDSIICGYIDSQPDIRDYRVDYVLNINEIRTGQKFQKVTGKVLLSVKGISLKRIYSYGDKVSVHGSLNIPKGIRNPGGFDYRSYLLGKGIKALVSVSPDDIKWAGMQDKNILVATGLSVRNRIVSVFKTLLPKEQAALLSGMTVGYTADMSDDVKRCFSDSGLSHIVAVSGMNVAFIVVPLMFILKKIRLGQKSSSLIIISTLIFFVFVTGFSASVVRAVIMASTILSSVLFKRESDIYTSISLAALILMLQNPFTLFDVGFQLSFMATLSIVLLYPLFRNALGIKHIPRKISDLVAVTLAAQIGIIPVTAYHFNTVSIISLVSNLITVPLLEVITIAGFIGGFLGQINPLAAYLPAYFDNALLSYILYISKISSQLPFAVLKLPTPNPLLLILYFSLVLTISFYGKLKEKGYLKPVLLIPAASTILLVMTAVFPKNLEVVFLDVGQGNCTFIRTPEGKTVLIDTGDKGGNNVLSFLTDFGVLKLDTLIVTNSSMEHTSGFLDVINNMKPSSLVLPSFDDDHLKNLSDTAKNKGITVYFCDDGDVLRPDTKTSIHILYPEGSNKTTDSPFKKSSMVLKLVYGSSRFLFTSDIS